MEKISGDTAYKMLEEIYLKNAQPVELDDTIKINVNVKWRETIVDLDKGV